MGKQPLWLFLHYHFHGVTKKQKRILQAFGIDVPLVTYWAKEISKKLKEISAKAKKGSDEE